MGTVTQYNLANVQAALGGANPISMSEYYRGGAYVPTSRTTTVREPTSGENYNYPSSPYTWWETQTSAAQYSMARWSGAIYTVSGTSTLTSITSGSSTYYRGSYRTSVSDPYSNSYNIYALYRITTTSTSINTGVPSSGTISISQLYGAENP